ncbi:hypothetical protein FQZ97_1136170 [compost metagenome]
MNRNLKFWLYSMPKNSWNGTPPSFALRPNSRPMKVGAGTDMPFGPPVKESQLLRIRRMISPKPRVTIAR